MTTTPTPMPVPMLSEPPPYLDPTEAFRQAVVHELRRQTTAAQATTSRVTVVAWLLGTLLVLSLLGQLVAGIQIISAF